MSEPTPSTRLVDDSLFVGDEPALRGAACPACATTTFPAQDSCPRCGATGMAEVPLPRSGSLWSFTVQSFEPKSPYRGIGEFEPYGVGYVDLGPVIVESRLTVHNPGALAIGQPFELQLIPAFEDEDGTTVLTFAFAPATDATATDATASGRRDDEEPV
jgi:uncharacterized protein